MPRRREVRERVLQALYAYEVGHDTAEHVIETILRPALKEDAAALRFAISLFLRTLDYSEEADRLIGAHVQNWDLTRIALIDRLLLRMAICELLTFEDIPPKVSMNEAIELAKRYSTEKSGSFVNGVLDAVVLDLQRQGRLKKSGRGLIGIETLLQRLAAQQQSKS
ncbi:transcription antitermination factor NusB [Rhodothermus bifroesti]|uniref:Transcription antitermination protein NusB n=1 Tax=Rhodothermus marinus TaxID=29549 RepID=A0A7V2F7F9_RHOMR|nr:transcription antitermination factor NusB [Rhodothermus bifroesti]GBD02492.1 N utilization substance protein B [bacterium HR18]